MLEDHREPSQPWPPYSLGQTDKKPNPLNILQSGTFHFKLQSSGNEREKKGKKFDLTLISVRLLNFKDGGS